MANTLRRIAEDPDNFYNGDLAKDIASDLEQVGSWINITDLNIYDVNITEPLKSVFDGKEFYFPKAQEGFTNSTLASAHGKKTTESSSTNH